MCQKKLGHPDASPPGLGDKRFIAHYRRIRAAGDQAHALRTLSDEEVIQALAAASNEGDPYLANVLATEAMNRLRRTRAVTTHLTEGALAVGADLVVTFANETLVRLLGGSRGDYAGRPLDEAIVLRETGGRVVSGTALCPITRCLAGGQWGEWEGEVAGVSGEFVAASFHVAPILREGEVEGVVATFRDVTERRRVLDALRDSEGRYRSIVEQSPFPVFTLDVSGTLLSVNDPATRVMHRSREELLGTNMLAHLAEHDRERASGAFANVLSGETRTDEYDVIGGDGKTLRARVTGIPMRVGDEIVGAHCVAEDVTEARRQERALRARDRQHAVVAQVGQHALEDTPLQRLFDEVVEELAGALDLGCTHVLQLDPDGRALTVRAAHGWRGTLVRGATKVDAGADTQAGYTLLCGRPVIVHDLRTESRLRNPALLREFGVRSGVTVVIAGEGKPWGILGAFSTQVRDFNEDDVNVLKSLANVLAHAIARRAAERNLESRVAQRTSELQAALRDLDTFASTVSHDLRAPLRGVSFFAQELLAEPTLQPPVARELAERLVAEAARATRLVHDLLDFSRSRSEPLAVSDVDLAAMARDIVAELAVQYPAYRTQWTIPERMVVRGDPHLLRVALRNLLENAAKYSSERDPPRVELALRETDAARILSVQDNGIGFDAAHATRLFEPFLRLSNAARFEGTGLGLPTVHRIVERHGGRLWAEGAPGRGATFHVSLPA